MINAELRVNYAEFCVITRHYATINARFSVKHPIMRDVTKHREVGEEVRPENLKITGAALWRWVVVQKSLKQKERVKPVYRSVYSLRRVCYLYFGRVSTMTRKKFIKTLMSHGISRNAARRIAENNRKYHGSYAEGINSAPMLLLISCADTRISVKRIRKVFSAVVQSIKRGLDGLAVSCVIVDELHGMKEEQEGKNNA